MVAVKKKSSGVHGTGESTILVPWTAFLTLLTWVTIRQRFQAGFGVFEEASFGLCKHGDADFRLVSGFSRKDLFPF